MTKSKKKPTNTLGNENVFSKVEPEAFTRHPSFINFWVLKDLNNVN